MPECMRQATCIQLWTININIERSQCTLNNLYKQIYKIVIVPIVTHAVNYCVPLGINTSQFKRAHWNLCSPGLGHLVIGSGYSGHSFCSCKPLWFYLEHPAISRIHSISRMSKLWLRERKPSVVNWGDDKLITRVIIAKCQALLMQWIVASGHHCPSAETCNSAYR